MLIAIAYILVELTCLNLYLNQAKSSIKMIRSTYYSTIIGLIIFEETLRQVIMLFDFQVRKQVDIWKLFFFFFSNKRKGKVFAGK